MPLRSSRRSPGQAMVVARIAALERVLVCCVCYTDAMPSTITYTVVLERDLEGSGFVATCPMLPGLVTEGDTVEATLDMARDAIRAYVESLLIDGLPIPEEREPIVSPVTVDLAGV